MSKELRLHGKGNILVIRAQVVAPQKEGHKGAMERKFTALRRAAPQENNPHHHLTPRQA